jgi:ABC-type nitrate/sulfonate/bicarbonate transport system substrate-binding protein
MKTIKVILDWFPNTNHTGFYIALKKGYFQEAGLDVQISGDVHGVLETHAADMVVAPQISILEKIAEGKALTAIATLTQKNDSGIVSLKESGITSPKMLEGKRLTHWEPEWFHGIIGKAVEKDGGDYSKVNLVPMDVGDIVGTLGNTADATWVYENWENQELIEAGKEINYFNLADIDPLFDFCAPCLGATHKLLEERPDDVRNFLACLDRGYREAAKHPEEAILLVKEYMPNVSDELLIRSQKHLAGILLDKSGHWGYIAPERWNPMADWLIEQNLYDKRRSTEFTNDYLPSLVKK